MEYHLAGGEGAWACAGGWEVLARDSQAHHHTQHGLWNTAPWEGSPLPWSCPGGAAVGWCHLTAPQFSHKVLEFTPVNERVVSLRRRVGDRSLAVAWVYRSTNSTEYWTFMESLGWGGGGVLDIVPTGDPIVLLGNFNTYVGNDIDT